MPMKEWIIVPKHLESHVTVSYVTDASGNTYGSINPVIAKTENARITKNTRVPANSTVGVYVVGYDKDGTLVVGNDRALSLTDFKQPDGFVTNPTSASIAGTATISASPIVSFNRTKSTLYERTEKTRNGHSAFRGNGYQSSNVYRGTNIDFWYDRETNGYDAKGTDNRGLVLTTTYKHEDPQLGDRSPLIDSKSKERLGFSMGTYSASASKITYATGCPFDLPLSHPTFAFRFLNTFKKPTEATSVGFNRIARVYRTDKSYVTNSNTVNDGDSAVVGMITSKTEPLSGKFLYSTPSKETSENRIILNMAPPPRYANCFARGSWTVLNPTPTYEFTIYDAQSFVSLPATDNPVFDTWRIKILTVAPEQSLTDGIVPFAYDGTSYTRPSHFASSPYLSFLSKVSFIWDGNGKGGMYLKDKPPFEGWIYNNLRCMKTFEGNETNNSSSFSIDSDLGLTVSINTTGGNYAYTPLIMIPNDVGTSISYLGVVDESSPIPDSDGLSYGSILGFSETSQKLYFYGSAKPSQQLHRLIVQEPHPSPTSTAWNSKKYIDNIMPNDEGGNFYDIMVGDYTKWLKSIEFATSGNEHLAQIYHNSITTISGIKYQNLDGQKVALVGSYRYQPYPYTVTRQVLNGVETASYRGIVRQTPSAKYDSASFSGSTLFYFDGNNLNIKSDLKVLGSSSTPTEFNFDKPQLKFKNIFKRLTIYRTDDKGNRTVYNGGWQKEYWGGSGDPGGPYQIDYYDPDPSFYYTIPIVGAVDYRLTFMITHTYIYERWDVGAIASKVFEVIELDKTRAVNRRYIEIPSTKERIEL
jgi:hypothetical protein